MNGDRLTRQEALGARLALYARGILAELGAVAVLILSGWIVAWLVFRAG